VISCLPRLLGNVVAPGVWTWESWAMFPFVRQLSTDCRLDADELTLTTLGLGHPPSSKVSAPSRIFKWPGVREPRPFQHSGEMQVTGLEADWGATPSFIPACVCCRRASGSLLIFLQLAGCRLCSASTSFDAFLEVFVFGEGSEFDNLPDGSSGKASM